MLPKAVLGSLLASVALGASNFPIPQSAGVETFKEPREIATSETFDGGLKTYGRGVVCTGQKEGGDSDAVFILQEGATLKNAIIGADQIEGWEKVYEDALSLKKGNGPYKVIGGGAQGAEDKVIQHNAGGGVTIDGFVVSDFGKLFRSCGNCKTQSQRSITISNVKAYNGKVLAGVNENYGDHATIKDSCATSVKDICKTYKGNEGSGEPSETGSGPSEACTYTDPLPAC
ncbi:pectate lyase [Aspergillus coremiiformis]|uniref:Pectate lyase n=1 Tax=Aspergillus coremiiformis TaxID=138285 RepID=A0A5N6Z779_9EURO|nr:pectate lyase [Aspergillus coremiiformis]